MEKFERIQCDLAEYKITLEFPGRKAPLVVHFDTPSRRFYFSIIALIITEMKKQEVPGFVHMPRHKDILRLLDKSLSGKKASENVEGMWAKINMAWRNRLPDLESAALFKVLDRSLSPPMRKVGNTGTNARKGSVISGQGYSATMKTTNGDSNLHSIRFPSA